MHVFNQMTPDLATYDYRIQQIGAKCSGTTRAIKELSKYPFAHGYSRCPESRSRVDTRAREGGVTELSVVIHCPGTDVMPVSLCPIGARHLPDAEAPASSAVVGIEGVT
jgi:hypothetical protein